MATKTCDGCPPPVQLNGLLSGSLPEEQQSGLVSHLDTCETCQTTLQALAAGSDIVPAVAKTPALPAPGPNSAYWRAIKELEKAAGIITPETQTETALDDSNEELSLDFLERDGTVGILGRLDHFDVLEVIGRGGMGVVLKAFDACLHRFVAIKILAPQLAASSSARQRFIREVRAAAAIRHENVVAIHSVDDVQGRPYLVMEYVPGISLEERLERHGPPPLKDIVWIAAQTAAGLAAAHEQGLVHRDIKPGNILLEDGVQRVKITDFGLARAVDDGRLTQTGLVVGTPQYMAPEQAQGHDVDHRADLFSLGSVLYALSTGRAPFAGSSAMAILLAVYKETPQPIREVNPEIPEWLSDIVAKLQAKDPADRYQTAAEVADLLKQHACHLKNPQMVPQPVSPAKPPSSGRWAGLLGALFGHRPVAPTPVTSEPHIVETPPRAILQSNTGPIWSVAFSPDDDLLAMGIDDGTVKLWHPAAGRVRATLNAHRGPVWSVAFSPDGSRMATASDDGTVKLWDPVRGMELQALLHTTSVRAVAFGPDGNLLATGSRDGSVRIWNLKSNDLPIITRGHAGVVMNVAVSPDGRVIASSSGDKTIKLWDAETGLEQLTLQGHLGGVYAIAFSPDNQRLASGSWDKSVIVWDVATGNRLATLQGHDQDVWGVAFSPDGRTLASASEDRTVRLWDVQSGRETKTLRSHTGTVYSVAFSHNSQMLASGSRDGTVRLWDHRR